MKEDDEVSGGAGDGLVEGIVEAGVRLADQAEAAVEAGLPLVEEVEGAIGGETVLDEELVVRALLTEETVEGGGEGGDVVAAGGDDGQFHGATPISVKSVQLMKAGSPAADSRTDRARHPPQIQGRPGLILRVWRTSLP